MKIKSIVAILLILLLGFCMVGCGNEEPKDPVTDIATDSSAETLPVDEPEESAVSAPTPLLDPKESGELQPMELPELEKPYVTEASVPEPIPSSEPEKSVEEESTAEETVIEEPVNVETPVQSPTLQTPETQTSQYGAVGGAGGENETPMVPFG